MYSPRAHNICLHSRASGHKSLYKAVLFTLGDAGTYAVCVCVCVCGGGGGGGGRGELRREQRRRLIVLGEKAR